MKKLLQTALIVLLGFGQLYAQNAFNRVNIPSAPSANEFGIKVDGKGTVYIGSTYSIYAIKGTEIDTIQTPISYSPRLDVDLATGNVYELYGRDSMNVRMYDGNQITELPELPLRGQYTQYIKYYKGNVYAVTMNASDRASTLFKYDGATWSIVGAAGDASGGIGTNTAMIDFTSFGAIYSYYRDLQGNAFVREYFNNQWTDITITGMTSYYAGGIAVDTVTNNLYIGAALTDGTAKVLKYDGVSTTVVGGSAFASNVDLFNMYYNHDTQQPEVLMKLGTGSYGAIVYSFNGSTWEQRTRQTAHYIDEIFVASAYDPYNKRYYTSFHEGVGHLYREADCSFDKTLTVTGTTLEANLTADAYQWGKVGASFMPIAGATSQQYIATEPGEYAVALTLAGCESKSEIVSPCLPTTSFDESFNKIGIPNCWNALSSNSNSNFDADEVLYSTSNGNPATRYAISPEVIFESGKGVLSFDAKGLNGQTNLAIGLLEIENDTTNFELFETITITDEQTRYMIDFTQYAGTGKYIAFKEVSSGAETVEIDNVIFSPFALAVQEICAGDEFNFGNQTLKNAGFYKEIFPSDSVAYLNLKVNSVFAIHEKQEQCSGLAYTFPDGNTLPSISKDTVYASYFMTQKGCDSIIYTTIDLPDDAINTQEPFLTDQVLCLGEIADVRVPNSVVGVNYSLLNADNNAVLVGPVEGTGDTLTIQKGNVVSAQNYKVVAEAEDIGRGLEMSGYADMIATATPTTFDYTSEYTFEAWVKTSMPASGKHATLMYAGGATGSDIEIYIQGGTNDLIVAHNRDNGASFSYGAFTGPTQFNNEFFHLAVVYGGGTCYVFYNGVWQNQTRTITPPVQSANSQLTFGYMNTNAGAWSPQNQIFSGVIDDIRIWNSGLNESAIAGNYNGPLTSISPDLQVYISLDDKDDTIRNHADSTATVTVNFNNGTKFEKGAIPAYDRDELCSYDFKNVMSINVQQPYSGTENITICSGSDYEFADGRIVSNITEGFTDVVTVDAFEYCDSTVTTNISVRESFASNEDISTCLGTQVQLQNGTFVTPMVDSVYEVHYQTTLGSCDSIYTTTVSVLSIDEVTPTVPAKSCDGTNINVQINSSEVGVSYYLRNDATNTNLSIVSGNGGGIQFPAISVTAPITANVYADIAGECGLEMTDKVELTADKFSAISLTEDTVCSGSSTSIIIANSNPSLRYYVRDENTTNELHGTTAYFGNGGDLTIPTDPITEDHDVYVYALTASNGQLSREAKPSLNTCSFNLDDREKIVVDAVNTKLTIVDDSTISAQATDVSYQWGLCGRDGATAGYENYTSQSFKAFEEGNFSVLMENARGCTSYSDCKELPNTTGTGTGLTTMKENERAVYPNPASDRIYLAIPYESVVSIKIYTATGVEVYSTKTIASNSLAISDLSNGLYHVVIETLTSTSVTQFVKQ